MNRKLRKFIKSPGQFFRDMPALQPLLAVLHIRGRKEELKPTAVKVLSIPYEKVLIPGLELFDLMGENWLETSNIKPIAILWGFNPWKRAQVSSYLTEFRTAYARRNSSWSASRNALASVGKVQHIIWGCSESDDLSNYLREKSLRPFRMEDGFIRSVELGSQHSLALSLVLDTTGIYFDASKPSDLENLLNDINFDVIAHLLRSTDNFIAVLKGAHISKYNGPVLRSCDDILGPRIKKRILVIGQVEDDASLRFGLVGEWTTTKILELACLENPGCEILYRPHPDVAGGYRKDTFSTEQVSKNYSVLSESANISELLSLVDHVYTMTSLTGLEALIRGAKVSVFGHAFYGGWGLTDDRVPFSRRNRSLTLQELVCVTYLVYPRYLANPGNSLVGALASAFKILGEREIARTALVNADAVKSNPVAIATSDLWPILLRPDNHASLFERFGKKYLSVLTTQRIFSVTSGDTYQVSMALIISGKLQGTIAFPKFLAELYVYLKLKNYITVLTELDLHCPSDAVLDAWSVVYESTGELDKARAARRQIALTPAKVGKTVPGFPIHKAHYGSHLKWAQFELRYRNFPAARQIFNRLLLSGHLHGDVFFGLSEIARLTFDLESAAELMGFYNKFEPNWRTGKGFIAEAQYRSYISQSAEALVPMSIACLTSAHAVDSVTVLIDGLKRGLGELPYNEAFLSAGDLSSSDNLIARAKTLVTAGMPERAERLLLRHKPIRTDMLRYSLTLSLAYSYQGRNADAKLLIKGLLTKFPLGALYREGLRLAVVSNDYQFGQELLLEATRRDIDVGDMYQRKIALGLGDIEGSYYSFRSMRAHKTLKTYLGKKYVQSFDEIERFGAKDLLVVACFGPGDEIRFASLYQVIANSINLNVSFTCEPRLYDLFVRSYPQLNFVPVSRLRSLASLKKFDNYINLPGSDLHSFFDNSGWTHAEAAGCVTLTTDLLGDILKGYSSFVGTQYLHTNLSATQNWKKKLGISNGPVIGINWRSSVTLYSRNEHYLSVEDVGFLLMETTSQFVNLQYDDCDMELSWLEEKYPGRIINFRELDQFNDLDGVASLMAALDLVIAPCTTVAELAGAIGVRTLLLSNSSELHWRKIPGSTTDVWHSAISHVEGAELGNKATLVTSMISAVKEFERDFSINSPEHCFGDKKIA